MTAFQLCLAVLLKTASVFSLKEDGPAYEYNALRRIDNCVFPYEIVFVQDATAGLKPLYDNLAYTEIRALYRGFEQTGRDQNLYGLLSFKDKPIWPLGNQPSIDNPYEDYCTQLDVNLTRDRQKIIDWYQSADPQGGGDPNENSFGALFAAAKTMAWDTDAVATRLAVLVTDSASHFENDQFISNLTSRRFQPFTTTYVNPERKCVLENYPSAETVRDALRQSSIRVAFLIQDDDNDRVRRAWRYFNDEILRQPAFYVVDLDRNGDQFASKLQNIIRQDRDLQCRSEEDMSTDMEFTTDDDFAGLADGTTGSLISGEIMITTELELEDTSDLAGMEVPTTNEEMSSSEVELLSTEEEMISSTGEEEETTTTEDFSECELLPTATSAPDLSSPLIACLEDAEITYVGPHSPSYFAETIPYNLYYPQMSPAAIVLAKTEADVQVAVRCGESANALIVPRSGGHDYSSYSYGQDGNLIIDLKYMDKFNVSDSGRATIGPGVRTGTMYYKSWVNGQWMFPGGSCTEMGMGGHLLGGGYGYYSRAYGLAVDHIASLRMVDHRGDVIIANQTYNSDLYWGLCGGGNGNFGIVTQIEYDLIKAPPVVTSAIYLFPPSAFSDVVDALLNLTNQAPRHLGISLTADSIVVAVKATWIGPEDELKNLVEPYFKDAPTFLPFYRAGTFIESVAELAITNMMDTRGLVDVPPSIDDSVTMTNRTEDPAIMSRKAEFTSELEYTSDYEPIKAYFKCQSLLFTDRHPMNKAGLDTLTTLYTQGLGQYHTFGFAFEMLGGPESTIRVQQPNSFPWRDVHWIMHIYSRSFAPLPQADVDYVLQMKSLLVNATGADAVYVNYHDSSLVNPLPKYYGTYLNRLQDIKNKYDPRGVFWYPQGIQPSSGSDQDEEAADTTTSLTDYVPLDI